MKIGTKSLLFGYHQFLIHPLFVAWAWWKLYGFPWDPRLWLAFFLHDVGYWGKPNMDGKEGESHPFTSAKLIGALLDYRDQFGHRRILQPWYTKFIGAPLDWIFGQCPEKQTWFCFVFYHSRFLCREYKVEPSRLCYADKLAIIITPTWLQLLLMNLTGEIDEYMSGQQGRTTGEGKTKREWVEEMKRTVRGYLSEKLQRCIACEKDCHAVYFTCDEELSGVWCPECFEKTPCGRGEHGEQCPTQVCELAG